MFPKKNRQLTMNLGVLKDLLLKGQIKIGMPAILMPNY